MEEMWPLALGAGVLMFVAPVRRRVKPVAGAVARAAIGLVGASVAGAVGVANAVVRGEAGAAGESAAT
jgi:hypothetical protein